VAGASFLDLYSGTGQIGIEALSRGAERAVFVESDKRMAELIGKNIAKCRLDAGSAVIRGDVRNALDKLCRTEQPFDIVYLDPPYEAGELGAALEALTGGQALVDGALVVAEQAAKAPPISGIPELQVYKIKEYSTTKLTFMKYTQNLCSIPLNAD